MLTDVKGIMRDFGTDAAALIERLSPAEAEARGLATGSMGPKAEAAARFAATGQGRRAGIGRLGEALEILEGRAGTLVTL